MPPANARSAIHPASFVLLLRPPIQPISS
jgi:hypothetical protein